jgi:hypothetical protein
MLSPRFGHGQDRSTAHFPTPKALQRLVRLAQRMRLDLGAHAHFRGEREECEDAPALVPRDLRDDVRNGAEAVQAEPLAVAGQDERPVDDQAGAEKRRGLQVGVSPRGIGKLKRSSATAYSAKPPSTAYPVKRARSQRFSRPDRQ